jgi:p-cumate 2,3-dioxygenase beta subunit
MHVQDVAELSRPVEAITRSEIEDLLFLEADLLDAWRLQEWLALYTEDAHYRVSSPGLPMDASPDDCLFLVNDDPDRMRGRVTRLKKKTAHSEYPHSTTMHLYSNVRILDRPAADEVSVQASFMTTRVKDGITDTYFGKMRYAIVRIGSQLRIRDKRCDLAMEALNPQGRVTILL